MTENEKLLQLLADQTVVLQELAKQIAVNKLDNDALQTNAAQRSMDLLANSLTSYIHDPLSKFTFSTWYARHEDVFTVDAKNLDDAAKVRLLLRKLDEDSHSKYVNFILPKKSNENSLEETVKILKRMFGEPESLFSIRYNCMKLVKKSSDDFIAFASIVNKECERFDFAKLTSDQFKCLIFICGLPTCDKEFRTRLLMKLESDAALTLATLTVECKRLMDLKLDAELIAKTPSGTSTPYVKQINDKSKKSPKTVDKASYSKSPAQDSSKKVPYRPCWLCGAKHFVKECTYVKHLCRDCNKIGHKEGFCVISQQKNQSPNKGTSSSKQCKPIFTVSKVDHTAKRKYIVVLINGCPIRLQVDTASDVTIISRENYKKLGHPSAIHCTELAQTASGGPLSLEIEFECKILFNDVDTTGICYASPMRTI